MQFLAVRDYVEGLPKVPILGLDIHSFANKLLYPYGYKKGTVPDNIDEIKELAEKAIKEVDGMEVIQAGAFGEASGATDDWMRGEACIRFVYTFELPGFLPGHDKRGFHPDEKHYYPTALQVRNAINVMLKHMKDLDKKGDADAKDEGWCDMSGNGAKVPIGEGPAV